jgi:hypothetical protein
MNTEHRFKILRIPYETLLGLFEDVHDCNIFSKIKLPNNVNVASVHNNYQKHEFGVVLQSPYFEEVPVGEEIPESEFEVKQIQKWQLVELDA